MTSQYAEMGRRIKLRRKELKIKQSEMAESLNISNNHLSSDRKSTRLNSSHP